MGIKVRYGIGDEESATPTTSVKALLFGQLMDLAAPFVKHYRSDFYHDAHWLDTYFTGAISFYYGVRESGTAIGTSKVLAGHCDRVYEVTITRDDARGWWNVTIEEV